MYYWLVMSAAMIQSAIGCIECTRVCIMCKLPAVAAEALYGIRWNVHIPNQMNIVI